MDHVYCPRCRTYHKEGELSPCAQDEMVVDDHCEFCGEPEPECICD